MQTEIHLSTIAELLFGFLSVKIFSPLKFIMSLYDDLPPPIATAGEESAASNLTAFKFTPIAKSPAVKLSPAAVAEAEPNNITTNAAPINNPGLTAAPATWNKLMAPIPRRGVVKKSTQISDAALLQAKARQQQHQLSTSSTAIPNDALQPVSAASTPITDKDKKVSLWQSNPTSNHLPIARSSNKKKQKQAGVMATLEDEYGS